MPPNGVRKFDVVAYKPFEDILSAEKLIGEQDCTEYPRNDSRLPLDEDWVLQCYGQCARNKGDDENHPHHFCNGPLEYPIHNELQCNGDHERGGGVVDARHEVDDEEHCRRGKLFELVHSGRGVVDCISGKNFRRSMEFGSTLRVQGSIRSRYSHMLNLSGVPLCKRESSL